MLAVEWHADVKRKDMAGIVETFAEKSIGHVALVFYYGQSVQVIYFKSLPL